VASINAHIPAQRRPYAPRKFTKRTKARFISDRTDELMQHLGRDTSFPERLLIQRVVALEWELRRTDALIDDGSEPSGHVLRARLAAENRLRLDLAALGLRPHGPRIPTLAEITAEIAAGREVAA
jgi:hypothetical protein